MRLKRCASRFRFCLRRAAEHRRQPGQLATVNHRREAMKHEKKKKGSKGGKGKPRPPC